jgi:cytochrome c biogenesis protein CcmG, thiol:disulfide interchange protein DsbE
MAKNKIQLIIVGTFVVIAALAVLYTQRSGDSAQSKREQILTAQNVYGSKVFNESSMPKVVILNFWASWCPPCIAETPDLIKFAKQLGPDFKLLMVSQDSDRKDIERFIKMFPDILSEKVEVIYDETRSFSKMYKVEKLPETFFINLANEKVLQVSGSQAWLDSALLLKIREELKKQNIYSN